MIRPVGPCPARIMIVGEAPGEQEEREGVPFVGYSGMELSRMLQEAGIMRSACFITNVVRIRPPGNDINAYIASRKADITGSHITLRGKFVLRPVVDGIDLLKREIELCQPNVIIAVDVSARMQFDANGNYFDPNSYATTGAAWENTIGVPAGSTAYRRMFKSLVRMPIASSDRYTAELIQTMGNNNPLYTAFWARTRLEVAREALATVVQSNARLARFGLLKMRQMNLLDRNESVVCVCTGHVLKDPDTVIKNAPPLISCKADTVSVRKAIKS